MNERQNCRHVMTSHLVLQTPRERGVELTRSMNDQESIDRLPDMTILSCGVGSSLVCPVGHMEPDKNNEFYQCLCQSTHPSMRVT